MKLLAGSLDVEVDAYLHAGYLSARVRPFDQQGRYDLAFGDTNLIDVKQSLELKDTGTPIDQTAPLTTANLPPPPPTALRSAFGGEAFLVAIVLLFFGGLSIHYWRRLGSDKGSRWRTQLLVLLPLLLIAAGTIGFYSVLPRYEARQLNNRPPPWKGVTLREYQDPAAATEAIMHALVANAIPGSAIRVERLGAIQNEVTFPLPVQQWTPGMAYAVQTYGLDGWGRELRLRRQMQGRYRISSAGPDGQYHNDDDIEFVTARTDRDNWEQLVNGVFARRVDGAFTYFVHRVAHRKFQTSRLAAAKEANGTDVFDLLPGREVPRRSGEGVDHKSLEQKLDEYGLHEEGDGNDDPLLFIRIMRAEDV